MGGPRLSLQRGVSIRVRTMEKEHKIYSCSCHTLSPAPYRITYTCIRGTPCLPWHVQGFHNFCAASRAQNLLMKQGQEIMRPKMNLTILTNSVSDRKQCEGQRSRYRDSRRARQFGDRKPVRGEKFSTRLVMSWGPPSLLCHGYELNLRGKAGGACC